MKLLKKTVNAPYIRASYSLDFEIQPGLRCSVDAWTGVVSINAGPYEVDVLEDLEFEVNYTLLGQRTKQETLKSLFTDGLKPIEDELETHIVASIASDYPALIDNFSREYLIKVCEATIEETEVIMCTGGVTFYYRCWGLMNIIRKISPELHKSIYDRSNAMEDGRVIAGYPVAKLNAAFAALKQ